MNTTKQTTSNDITTKEQFWSEHILLKRKNGLTRKSYCQKHKLNLIQFTYWEQKYNSKNTNSGSVSSNLMPIKLDKSQPPISVPTPVPNEILCVLSLKNGNNLKIYNKSVLPFLLSALG